MADTGRGAELPRRVPGAARAWSAWPISPVALVLPEHVRQRVQAAVRTERAQAAVGERERAAGDRVATLLGRVRPPESLPGKDAGPEEASSPANGTSGKRKAAGACVIALSLAVIVIGSLAAAVAGRTSLSPSAVRAQAAAWVAQQVSPDVTVSCDAVMCAALQAHGFPARELVVLGPASPDPVPSVLVVETAAVSELFGSSLAIAWAPAILASFGSGTAAITVRVVAPHGAAAYQAALNAGLASRKRSGAALLRRSQVTVSAMARSQLLAGQVDSRLLLALTSLTGHEPIDIVRFGNLGPGASPGVLLRFADLAENIPAARIGTAAYVRSTLAVLAALDARILPARAVSGPVQGQAIFRLEFPAPSPLRNFGPGSP